MIINKKDIDFAGRQKDERETLHECTIVSLELFIMFIIKPKC
ncbi:MAG: hypothetical protein MPEBLZ_01788 [Candidatus Methanoperedens nitroreducens]|uniref:Uncharacterized protein n=1 Tax=Candidatus Methanoperedens nitratireducens TaxID=1392998 RepID=A0A0P7ZFP0_9EURY|nr:MAG: hypothetical protein MPEBLZ_01788 [Candidatus Methanoperedens sp. BLZ1]